MHHTTLRTSAALSAALLALTACSDDVEPGAQPPAPTAQDSTATAADTQQGAGAEPTAEDEEEEPEQEAEERPDVEGLTFHDEPAGYIMAPNGAYWQHHGTFDLDSLAESTGQDSAARGAESVGCESQWAVTEALWLRQYNDSEGGDYFQDEYDVGPLEGPTCFSEPGGTVASPEYRLVHYVCQTANTTSRTLVAPAEGGARVWTPEYTTGDERKCFTFDGGEEVRAYVTEVQPAG